MGSRGGSVREKNITSLGSFWPTVLAHFCGIRLTSPPYHLLGTSFDASFDASFGYRSGPKGEEAMGKRLPNDMPNEQWGGGNGNEGEVVLGSVP